MSEDKSTPQYLSVNEALRHAETRPLLGAYWTKFLSAFFAFFILSTVIWLTGNTELKKVIVDFTWQPMAALGWYQNWSLFSPDVRHISYHETAVITFKDGSSKIYEYPRMDKMSIIERFRREKLRKMFSDNMPWPGFTQFLPVFARHLAKANYDKENPPVLISYVFNVVETPDPEKEGVVPRAKPLKHTNKSITFVYQVRAKDFAAYDPNFMGNQALTMFNSGEGLEGKNSP